MPFRAARIPSERNEYGQPDVAIILTHLAYYHDGLSQKEFMEALQKLLMLGPNTQATYYSAWLYMACSRGKGMKPGKRHMISSLKGMFFLKCMFSLKAFCL